MERKDAQIGQLVKTSDGVGFILGVDVDTLSSLKESIERKSHNSDKATIIAYFYQNIIVTCYNVCPRTIMNSDYMEKVSNEYAKKMAEHLLTKTLNEKRLITSYYNLDVLGQIDKEKIKLWLLKSQMSGIQKTYMSVKEVEEKVLKPFLERNKTKISLNGSIQPDFSAPIKQPQPGEFVVAKTDVNYLYYLYLGKKYGKDYYLPIVREKIAYDFRISVSRNSLLKHTSYAFKGKTACNIKHKLYSINFMYPDLERVKLEYDRI